MACLRVRPLHCKETMELLESYGFKNVQSCSEKSYWHNSVKCIGLFFDVSTVITSIASLLVLVYNQAFVNGKEEAKKKNPFNKIVEVVKKALKRKKK